MKRPLASVLVAGAVIAYAALGSAMQPAMANTTTTAAIAAGAAAIVGALLIDGNNHRYYINNDRRYYVTQPEANYWRERHHVVKRQAYVREQRYPIARDPYRGNQHH